MRILVTNDDGIDSVGLHRLARAVAPLGEVTVVAPDREYSGAGAAIGALHLLQPEIHRSTIEGLDDVWTVSGPPALCVMFANLGAFGPVPELIVSGINPGANVGRSVYHSGTVGAVLTGRNAGINGIAVSQEVTGWSIEGQGWDEMIADQKWDTAAAVAASIVEHLVAEPPTDPVALNVNVPNIEPGELAGWRWTHLGVRPPRTMGSVKLEPKEGHEGTFKVKMHWGRPVEMPPDTDSGAVMAGLVSVSVLSRLEAVEPHGLAATAVEKGLAHL